MKSATNNGLVKDVTNIGENPYQKLLHKQQALFTSGATRSVNFRIEQLIRLKDAIEANEQKILQALKEDLGKSPFEAYTTEVSLLKREINYFIKKLRFWAKPKKVPTSLALGLARCVIEPHPKGSALIISPFNYPIHLALMPLVGSIGAGNCSVLKPSELTPSCSQLLGSIIESYFDESYIAAVQGDVQTTQHLLSLRWDHVFFTGSVRVGKIVASAAARFLTPVTLELGGKNPCIVSRDANLKIAARRIVFGKYLNAGQTCVAPDYLLVDESIYANFMNQLKKEMNLRYGLDPQKNADYGRIVNRKHLERLAGFLHSGPQSVLVGGKVDFDDLYMAPTLLGPVTLDHPIMEDEIFGPILPVMRIKSTQEAESIIGNFPNPLACYYFGADMKKAHAFLDRVPSGGAAINDTIMQLTNHHLPFGGIGNSGIGAYHGHSSFVAFSHQKSVMETSTIIDPPVRYLPSRNWKQKLVRLLLG